MSAPAAPDAPPPAALPEPVRVLVAEDEPHLGALLEQFLVGRGCAVTVVRDGRAALARIRAGGVEVALLDVQMPGLDGFAVLRAARERPLAPEVVIVTGNGTAQTAPEALRHGAYDHLAKPYRMTEVELLVRRAAEKHRLRRAAAAARGMRPGDAVCAGDEALVTGHPALRAVLALVDEAAPGDAPALVVGAPGTGRRALARRLHAASGRSGPLVTVDASAPDVVARLFGGPADDGGPTAAAAPDPAADDGRAPALALAAGGTLCVREGHALDAAALERLLDATLPAAPGGPRLVVATSCARAALVARWGAPLLERVAMLDVALPPLAARGGDVALLVDALLRAAPGGPPVVTAAALARLEGAPWPGNVAELRATLAAALPRARAAGGVLDVAALAVAPLASGER